MNRRQKIIVSVVGIFLVLLILVGLTYAYFLTKIQGNTESTSITVKTANLALVYGDGNGTIGSASNTIKPGDEIGSKTFTVKNEGNATTGYVVVIEDVVITDYSINKTNLEDESVGFVSNDFRYTLTCESDGGVCNGISDETVFPMKGGIVVGNNIEVGRTQTYTLTVVYKETGENQSDDMNKGLTAKVNIKDIKEINPYSDKTSTLAYNIINNAKLNKNGTELLAVPKSKNLDPSFWYEGAEYVVVDFTDTVTKTILETYLEETVGQDEIKFVVSKDINNVCNGDPVNEINENIVGKYLCLSMESAGYEAAFYIESYDSTSDSFNYILVSRKSEETMSVVQDDYGASYYYRGNVKNNYVNFAGMCWRIVRIAGDGSTKLILEDQDEECSSSMNGNWDVGTAAYGYTLENDTYKINYLNSSVSAMADKMQSFQKDKLSGYTDKLKSGDWCYDDTAYQDEAGTTSISDTSSYYANGTTFYYGTHIRLSYSNKKQPSLKCSGTNMTKFGDDITDMYVGALTADEVVFAGGTPGDLNGDDYYLKNNYQKVNEMSWLTLSPSNFGGKSDKLYYVSYTGFTYETNVYDAKKSIRPSINLVSNVEITGGDGTIDNPYVVN